MTSLHDLLTRRSPPPRTEGDASPYQLPPELIKEPAGKSEATISTILANFCTGLSEHRTSLSYIRSHLANERTHLAQTRTAISLMSFGITLNRFSLYLQENDHAAGRANSLLRDAENIGIGMVVLGIIFLIWSLYRYRRVSKEIETMTFTQPQLSVTIMTIAIIALGAMSAIWLFLS